MTPKNAHNSAGIRVGPDRSWCLSHVSVGEEFAFRRFQASWLIINNDPLGRTLDVTRGLWVVISFFLFFLTEQVSCPILCPIGETHLGTMMTASDVPHYSPPKIVK